MSLIELKSQTNQPTELLKVLPTSKVSFRRDASSEMAFVLLLSCKIEVLDLVRPDICEYDYWLLFVAYRWQNFASKHVNIETSVGSRW